jgi:hypothetical protein
VAQITSYTTLKENVADWLNRTDLTSQIPVFIQLFEKKAMRDIRLRKLQNAGEFTASADGDVLPTDFMSLEGLYHDGSTYFGPIEIKGASELPGLKARYGTTGAPRFAAVVDGTLLYAPVPDDDYSLKLQYWRKVSALSASNESNWLLEDHPDVYLYGALVAASPFIKDDERVLLWKGLLDEAINEISMATANEQFGGDLRREHTPIGHGRA